MSTNARDDVNRYHPEQARNGDPLNRLIERVGLSDYLSTRLGLVCLTAKPEDFFIMSERHGKRGELVSEDLSFKREANGSWTYIDFDESSAKRYGSFQDFAHKRLGLGSEELAKDLERFELEKKLRQLPVLDLPTSSMVRLGIRPETLNSSAFRGTIRLDTLGALVLAQRNGNGFCGIERFSASQFEAGKPASAINGERGLWVSKASGPRETKLVITATPLEALAYHQLHPSENVRYVCTGNADLTNTQKESLQRALGEASKLGRAPEVVVAFGRDGVGDKLSREVTALCRDHVVRRHSPELGTNWTQALQVRERDHIRSLGHRVGSGLQR